MEFEVFTPKQTRSSKKPALRINRKGLIWINAAFAESMIALKDGDSIDFMQEKKSKEWYLAKRTGGAFTVKSHPKTKSLYVTSSALTAELFNCLNLPLNILKDIEQRKSLTIPMAINSVEGGHYALLTSAAH